MKCIFINLLSLSYINFYDLRIEASKIKLNNLVGMQWLMIKSTSKCAY